MISLQENEYVVYTARKHFFIFATEVIFVFIFAIIPVFFLPTEDTPAISQLVTGVRTFPFLWYLYTLWLTLLWLSFVYIWTDYYLDIWAITNKRVIDVDQQGLFNRKISDAPLDFIQDITVQVPGVLPTFIGYGNIYMQTAGQSREFIFKGVAYPQKIKEIILKEREKFLENRRLQPL